MKRLLFACALYCIFPSGSLAQPALGGSAVAVTPLRDSGLPQAEADRLERLLIAAVTAIPGLRVANEKDGKLTAPKRSSAEARFAEDPAARALALGGEWKTDLALAVDAASIGEGAVLYLQGVDVGKQKPIASTAFTVAAGPAPSEALSGALIRVLQPDRYQGVLTVNVDVPGAEVLVDGQPSQAGAPRPLSCGTHTVRVTHPSYHEFLKFVTIDYGHPEKLEVALSKYPIEEAELRERERQRRGHAEAPLAWWQRWYVVGVAALVLFGATAATAWGVTHSTVSQDLRVTCCSF